MAGKMKVAFPFVGRLLGGSHFSSSGLIQNLDRSVFDPVIVVDELDNPVAKFMRDAQAPIVAAPKSVGLVHGQRISLTNWVGIVGSLSSNARFLRRREIDVVHVNDGRTAAVWAAPARLAGAKLVWHHRSGPNARGLRYASPLFASAIISVSEFARGGAKLSGGRDVVIHSPFDTRISVDRHDARYTLIRELDCSPDARLIGFFGTLIARKRPFLFVEAIAAAKRRDPDTPILGLIFGEPIEISVDAVMDHAHKLGIADSIRSMGFRRPGSQWIAACDILAIPAVDEPFGRTLIEAMIVGTPVVATRSGGNPEALEHGRLGLLVTPDDADALAQGFLDTLTRDDETGSRTALARERVCVRFGEQQHADLVMNVYRRVLADA
jgi:glycosyltransferase involved in cell wall biosynthesis